MHKGVSKNCITSLDRSRNAKGQP